MKQENNSKLVNASDIKWSDLEKYDLKAEGKEAVRKLILSTSPPDNWVKNHPIEKKVRYLPIDKVEYLLRSFFTHHYTEIVSFGLLANSVSVHLRLYYKVPGESNYRHTDGLGASPLQLDKGTRDFVLGMKSSACMKALPAAKSFALKDAAEDIGRVFGADLNRKDTVGYEKITANLEGASLIEK